jgi:alkylated DNA repair dioxygenase AlkB
MDSKDEILRRMDEQVAALRSLETKYSKKLGEWSGFPIGWTALIDNLLAKLSKMEGWDTLEVQQVKSKFGGLRFYTGPASEEMREAIREAEHVSYETCTECGAPGRSHEHKGWIYTACPMHSKDTTNLMKIHFQKDYFPENLFEVLREEVPWVNRDAPRDECFMSVDTSLTYSYGNNNELREALHTYRAVPMHPKVLEILEKLNKDFGTSYNVCVLNYYKSEKQHLGWHADDSPEQDLDHPIAVVSFGAERYIYTKRKDFKGNIPDSDKYFLTNGSLFVMPGGYQKDHFHKIPKHDQPCGGRISMTFRKLDR